MKAVVNAAIAATTILLATLPAAQNAAADSAAHTGTPSAVVAAADGVLDPACVACWE